MLAGGSWSVPDARAMSSTVPDRVFSAEYSTGAEPCRPENPLPLSRRTVVPPGRAQNPTLIGVKGLGVEGLGVEGRSVDRFRVKSSRHPARFGTRLRPSFSATSLSRFPLLAKGRPRRRPCAVSQLAPASDPRSGVYSRPRLGAASKGASRRSGSVLSWTRAPACPRRSRRPRPRPG